MKNTSINIEVINENQINVLKNLVSLYLHDLSAFADDLAINDSGVFEYEGIELYFNREDLTPFFIKNDNNVVGFMLLNMGRYVEDNIDFCVHEFFILKSDRKKGFGKAAVKQLFNSYKGRYKIGQLASNTPALKFWHRIYEALAIEYSEIQEKVDGLPCVAQIFNIE